MIQAVNDGNSHLVRIQGPGDLPLTYATDGSTVTGATGSVDGFVDSVGVTPPGMSFPIPFSESPSGFYNATLPAVVLSAGTRYWVTAHLIAPNGSIFKSECELKAVQRC